MGKPPLNFIAELYASQTKMPFFMVTSNPQIVRRNLKKWEIARFGHASRGKGDAKINVGMRDNLSRKRLSVCLRICALQLLYHKFGTELLKEDTALKICARLQESARA